MTMTTVEVLRAARERIEDPDDWWNGSVVNGCSGYRAHACAEQAIRWTVGGFGDTDAHIALHRATSDMPFHSVQQIFDWNDSHSHAEVLAAFDRAIANEEARGAEFTSGVEEVEPVAAGGEMVLA